MTSHKSFKRLVRRRMEKTGESYTAARAILLRASEPDGPEGPPLATSDDAIRARTGRGWEEWFDLLDGWDAVALSHRDIARRVAAELGAVPLDWNVQAVTVSYERARGLRVVGQRADGFAVSASRTIAAAAEPVFAAVVDPERRALWLPGAALGLRTATAPRAARFDWGDDGSRLVVAVEAKGPQKCTLSLEHGRLRDAAQAELLKPFWRERLLALKAQMEET